jgi:hypothetical protein
MRVAPTVVLDIQQRSTAPLLSRLAYARRPNASRDREGAVNLGSGPITSLTEQTGHILETFQGVLKLPILEGRYALEREQHSGTAMEVRPGMAELRLTGSAAGIARQ